MLEAGLGWEASEALLWSAIFNRVGKRDRHRRVAGIDQGQ